MGRTDTNSPATDRVRVLHSASKIVSTKATATSIADSLNIGNGDQARARRLYRQSQADAYDARRAATKRQR